MHTKHGNQWVNEQKTTLSNADIVNKIIKNLYEKPFDTQVNLRNLSIEQCEKLTPLLKKWYEDTSKSRSIKDKIKIGLTVNNEEIWWTLNSEEVMKKLDALFNGDYTFSVD